MERIGEWVAFDGFGLRFPHNMAKCGICCCLYMPQWFDKAISTDACVLVVCNQPRSGPSPILSAHAVDLPLAAIQASEIQAGTCNLGSFLPVSAMVCAVHVLVSQPSTACSVQPLGVAGNVLLLPCPRRLMLIRTW